jgi:hypothetical protein
MSAKRPNQARLVLNWNKSHPVGCKVTVWTDGGKAIQTKTISQAWLLGGHSAVVSMEGITSCYALERVRPSC